jgi:hypothetical protein
VKLEIEMFKKYANSIKNEKQNLSHPLVYSLKFFAFTLRDYYNREKTDIYLEDLLDTLTEWGNGSTEDEIIEEIEKVIEEMEKGK